MSGHVWACLGILGHVLHVHSGFHISTLHVIAPVVQMFFDITKAELAFVFCCVTLLRGALVYFLACLACLGSFSMFSMFRQF